MIGLWDTHKIAAITSAEYAGGPQAVAAVETDTRKPLKGALFVALVGERFDGHDYIAQALQQGAVAALSSKSLAELKAAGQIVDKQKILVVDDTLRALGQIGRANRARFRGLVAAVTGSAGKTSVKEMLASILATRGAVAKTQGNLNNEIGVPLSLLQLNDQHVAGVFELGASAVGEIARTTRMTLPQVAILNNAGSAHLEGFGSLERIVQAKAEIFEGLLGSGSAVLNRDDKNYPFWLTFCQNLSQKPDIISFGFHESADVSAKNVQSNESGSSFTLVLRRPGDAGKPAEVAVHLQFAGRHNISNALAASAACFMLGLKPSAIAEGLSAARPVGGRLQFERYGHGLTCIDDSYNANPASMVAALDVLAGAEGVGVAVLGDMAELGGTAKAAHFELGAQAAVRGFASVFAIGQFSAEVRRGFESIAAKGDAECHAFTDKAAAQIPLVNELQARLKRGEGVCVLFKGSRSAGMETLKAAVLKRMGFASSAANGDWGGKV